jgi:hypothetical protein
MQRFLYLFRNNPAALKSLSPEQMEQRLKKTLDWIESLKRNGHMEGGERLDASGKVLRGAAKALSDGPYVEAKDIIGGYLLIAARDLDEALALAQGCPILESEGSVEIRPVIRA